MLLPFINEKVVLSSYDTNKRVSLNLSKKLRNTLFYGFGSMILKYPDNLGIYPTSLFAFFANKSTVISDADVLVSLNFIINSLFPCEASSTMESPGFCE